MQVGSDNGVLPSPRVGISRILTFMSDESPGHMMREGASFLFSPWSPLSRLLS